MIIIADRKKNIPERCYASIVDYLLILGCIIMFMYVAGEEVGPGAYHLTGFKTLLIPVLWFVYFPLCEGLTGQTLGKKLFHLHVVDAGGQHPTIMQAFLRRAVDPFEIVFFGLPAMLTIAFSEKNQRFGDMIAGTTVVSAIAICRHCGADVELTPREVIRQTFQCPGCEQTN